MVEALPVVAGLMTEPILFHRMLDEIHRDELSPQAMQAGLGDYLAEEHRLGRLTEVNVTPVGTLLMGAVIVIAMESQFAPVPVPSRQDPRLRAIVTTILRGLA
jgi:hypothetical protein